MHKVEMPKHIVQRVINRRGKAHIFDDFDPATTGLLVIDLQNAFLIRECAGAFVPSAVDIIPNVNRLAAAVRDRGGKVFWIQNTISPESRSAWSVWFSMMKGGPEVAERLKNLEVGSVGHQLHSGLDINKADDIVLKYRFSALIDGSSDLQARMRDYKLDTVIIVGALTNVCCESTARDAMMLNYKTIMVSDANATLTDEEHIGSLVSIYSSFGDVMSTSQLLEIMRI